MRPQTEPFRHVVLEQFQEVLCRRAAYHWPAPDWPGWSAVYDSPLERKRTCHDWRAMPEPCRELLRHIISVRCEEWFGRPLVPDLGLWGGGMHDMGCGDHLDLHLDADIHPACGLTRRVNAVLFLDDWPAEWGGALEFWDGDRKGPVVSIAPASGRLVLFETSDASYHGVPTPLACPPGARRKTLTVWWYGGAGIGHRHRAKFVGPAGEHDPVKDALRLERERPVGASG